MSDCHVHGDLGMGLVTLDVKVFDCEVLDPLDSALDHHLGEGVGFPLQLLFQGLHMVLVHMSIAQGVDEFTSLQA